MLEFFDVNNKEATKELKIKSKSSADVSIFTYLQDICYQKKGNIHLEKDFEMKKWSSFMILRYLSLDENYIFFINELNMYQGILTSEQMYKVLLKVLPKNKKFLQYPKLCDIIIIKKDELELLKTYFECSEKDIIEWSKLGLITKIEIDAIKKMYGGKENNQSIKKGGK